MITKFLIAIVFGVSGGLRFDRSKVRKSSKSRGVGPLFGVCKGFVVVIRRGCGVIRGPRSIVFDHKTHLLWYLIYKMGFKGIF